MRKGTILLAACLVVACRPLDRRDGALVVILQQVPDGVDTVELTVRAGGRTFDGRLPRPPDDRITDFSAIPVGAAELDVHLFAGDTEVDARLGRKLNVVENQTLEVRVNFVDEPTFTIVEPVEGSVYPLRGLTGIPVCIQPANSELTVELDARANGSEVPLARADDNFVGTIDPSLAGEVLPAVIAFDVTSCLTDAEDVCARETRSIVVTRAAWRTAVAQQSASRPVRWGDAIVLVDGAGTVRVRTATEGPEVIAPIELDAAIADDVAIQDDILYATADDGRVLSVELRSGATPTTKDLGATSPPVASAFGVLVAADRALIAIDDERTLAMLPRRVRARPLADEEGVVVADILGNVMALDATGAISLSTSVGAPVFAQPVRYRGRTVIATIDGDLIQLDAGGVEVVERVALGAPVVHAPVVLGDRLVVAADDRMFFIEDDRIAATVETERPITGAPAGWGEAAVVAGIQSGLVLRVSERGLTPIERVGGAAFGPLVLGRWIAVVGSAGDFALLEPEEGF